MRITISREEQKLNARNRAFRKNIAKEAKLLQQYYVVRITKKHGGHREIYVPSPSYKEELRSLKPNLEVIQAALTSKANSAYGYIPGKNCVLMAMQHIGYRFTLSFDLENFFDSITQQLVKRYIPLGEIEKCFINGKLRQGLPTSPTISNIAFNDCDLKISKALIKLGINSIYTRYVDDLVISFDDIKATGKIKFLVEQITNASGFKINIRKTKLQDAKNGRVRIVGIGVDRDGLHPTRESLRKLRAATHQNKIQAMHGLNEWHKLKLPKTITELG